MTVASISDQQVSSAAHQQSVEVLWLLWTPSNRELGKGEVGQDEENIGWCNTMGDNVSALFVLFAYTVLHLWPIGSHVGMGVVFKHCRVGSDFEYIQNIEYDSNV